MRCLLESTPPPGAESPGAAASLSVSIDVSESMSSPAEPTALLLERPPGERIKLTLDPAPASSAQYRITSTARLAEIYQLSNGRAAYAGTATGVSVAVGGDGAASSSATTPPFYYHLELLVHGPTELRLAGIKALGGGGFRLARVEATPVEGGTREQGEAATTTTATAATTQKQQLADLVALATTQGEQEEQREVPVELQELYAKMTAAPTGGAEAVAVKQLAAALARGVLLGAPPGGGGGGGAGGSGPADAEEEKQDRRQQGGPSQELQLLSLEAAIQRSEARILAAIDGLTRRVGALEGAVEKALSASRD